MKHKVWPQWLTRYAARLLANQWYALASSNVNFDNFFEFDTNRSTLNHSLKLKKKRFNTELRQQNN